MHLGRHNETFDKKAFDRCLRGLDVSVECEGSDLTRIVLTERQTSKTASRIQQRNQEFWLSILGVQQIDYAEEEQPEKQKLIQVCNDVNFLYTNVLVHVGGFLHKSHRSFGIESPVL